MFGIRSSILRHALRTSVSRRVREYGCVFSPISHKTFEGKLHERSDAISFMRFSTTKKEEKPSEEKKPSSTTKVEESLNPEESLEFKAETRQLLDIVTHSLYTEKQVFLRELISNASDALEKLRHMQAANKSSIDSDIPLEIRIETDEKNGTLTISDTGIGMNREEMIDNLGTIARSGSKAFMKQLTELKNKDEDGAVDESSKGIIGKFGVGFYSAFMVGDSVEVRSKSAIDEGPQKVWKSSGIGNFSISDLASDIRQDRGTSVIISLKEDELQYQDEKKVEEIIKKYSNFVNSPIYLNGNRVNTIKAIWSYSPKNVSKDAYNEFYKFIGNDQDDPLYTIHFHADAPLDIKALFFVPKSHGEKYGMSRMEPGVSIYSRKILIESKSKDILPDWMRFVKGVVDSEDLPLSISREKAQDNALIQRIRKALVRKFISVLSKEAKNNLSGFKENFYSEFSFFLKEGICHDYEFQESLSKLLFFETSKTMNKELSSFDEYIARCKPEQKDIYFLCTASRQAALESPYLEAFKNTGLEVIFVYSSIDDFVFTNLNKYLGREIVSIEKGDIDIGKKDKKDDKSHKIKKEKIENFCKYFRETLKDKVQTCKSTTRLTSTPAIITNHESGALRKMMRLVGSQDDSYSTLPLPKLDVEINPDHEVIQGITKLRDTEPDLAKVLVEQVFDNCLVAAGLMDDSRMMLPRINNILTSVVKGAMFIQSKENITSKKEEVTPEIITDSTDEIDLKFKNKKEEVTPEIITESHEVSGSRGKDEPEPRKEKN